MVFDESKQDVNLVEMKALQLL